MMHVLRSLEPLQMKPNVMIVEELEEFSEVLFFMTGSYQVGYSINREYRFPIRYGGCREIGAYGVSFNKRSNFAFKTFERCTGFFALKILWLKVLMEPDNEIMVKIFKKRINEDYIKNIKTRLLECKEFELRKLSSRADIDNVLSLQSVKKEKVSA